MNFSDFDIVWVSSCEYPCETGIQKHKHVFFHFIYADSGVGEITIGNKKYEMSAGRIYLAPPFVEHAFFNKGDTALKTLEIKFTLKTLQTEDAIKKLPYCINVKNHPIKAILSTILNESSDNLPMCDLAISYNFQLLMLHLLRCNERFVESSIHESDKKFSPEIKKVINYIYENLTEDISLEKLADIAGFEKNYFLRKFKKQTNTTPMSFIRDARLEKAGDLLRYSDMNISQIAIATGFKGIHYFSKVFFEHIGIRPIDYRNKGKLR
ncbi:MAG: helix-turn-helix domain-containing protein [Ruminococcaceae bacterium]|nr:helix-turn-helix domain-containing protein [Oscillospiraceae bacterium]